MKFNDMPYKRPDIEKVKAVAAEIIKQLSEAETFEEADKQFEAFQNLMADVQTDFTLAFVRHTINTNDEFYKAESDYSDEVSPMFSEIVQNGSLTLYNSKFRPEFEKKYGKILFTNIELMLKSFSPEIIPEMQEENKLATEYDRLIASAQIEFEGGTYTLSQLTPFKQVPDDERRMKAWQADGGFYKQNAQRLDEIYDSLVKVRDKMAKKLGYKNYIELGYYRMERNCYTASDVERFRNAVVKYIVPIATELYKEQAKRTGLPYPLNYSDMALAFRSGNPKPTGTPDDILAHGKKFYHELSKNTAEFIDFMYENELLDVLSRKGKSGGGYCTNIPKYKSQFIFANFNGTQHDVEVITHEAGHAYASYVANKNDVPLFLSSPTIEACEVHSMSMEFFAWPWAEGFFGKDTDKFYYNHLAGSLQFIPYGTMVDHFQHIVYEHPEYTPEQRHDAWRELLKVYMPWVKLGDEIPFYGEGKAWQRQSHIYERPFYYIDYCLAQTVALSFWALMQHDTNDAWNRYQNFVDLAGTRTFIELVEAAGLDTPFGDSALKKVAEEATAWLKKQDTSKLV